MFVYSCKEGANTAITTSESSTISATESLVDYINGLENPFNIGLFVTEDLTTSIAINFELPIGTRAYVEYAINGTDQYLVEEATKKTLYFNDNPVYLYEVVLSGLTPGVIYE